MQATQNRLSPASLARRCFHFGLITPPVSGHLHPFGALGRELIARGHRVTVFHMEDLRGRVLDEGLEFVAVGQLDHPAGSLEGSLAQIARRQGISALRFTIDAVRKTTEMTCRDVPKAVQEAGIDALLVDQMEPGGAAIADHLRLPYTTICNALLLNEDPAVPPPFTPWSYRSGALYRVRNWLGYRISERFTRSVLAVVNRYRQSWKLPEYRRPADSHSPLCQLSQQPASFDFPRDTLPRHFAYVGPLRRAGSRRHFDFPWHRLNGNPLIYCSLGTLQNRNAFLFKQFCQACEKMPVQLVIAHAGGLDPETSKTFPGEPIVVSYAPQLQVLDEARLTLTHAGLNTVLDSLSRGVPMVAIPLTYEQPAIASRIRWTGTGEILSLSSLSPLTLRRTIEKVLFSRQYQSSADLIKADIYASGGVSKAANLIESTHGLA